MVKTLIDGLKKRFDLRPIGVLLIVIPIVLFLAAAWLNMPVYTAHSLTGAMTYAAIDFEYAGGHCWVLPETGRDTPLPGRCVGDAELGVLGALSVLTGIVFLGKGGKEE